MPPEYVLVRSKLRNWFLPSGPPCLEVSTHASRQLALLRVLVHWSVVFSVGILIVTVVRFGSGAETWQEARLLLAAGALQLIVLVCLLVSGLRYPTSAVIFLATLLAMSIMVLHDAEAVSSGRYLIYFMVALIVAGAVLPPKAILPVLAFQTVLIFLAEWFLGGAQLLYTILTYYFVAVAMYLTDVCMHQMVEKLIEANRVRMEAINGVAHGYERIVEANDRAPRHGPVSGPERPPPSHGTKGAIGDRTPCGFSDLARDARPST